MELNVCPITHTPVNELKEPVITPDGITYEREAIEKWLIKNSTCPVTGKQLKIDQPSKRYIDLLYFKPGEKISNQQLKKMWKRKLNFYPKQMKR